MAARRQVKISANSGDKPGMRHFHRTLLLLLCLAGSSGCMILDEVDAANDKMAGRKKQAPAAATTTTPATPGANTSAILEETKRWWREASSLAPSGIDSSIVECRLDRGSQFMSRDDCLSRGGRPRNASG